MIKALQAIVNQHFQGNPSLRPTKNILDMIITCSRGDIRGAVMELQLSSLIVKKPTKKGKKGSSNDSVAFLKLASQREQSLALFHLIGKVLYNKRIPHFLFEASVLKCVFVGKGDPPSSSTTKREREQLRLVEQGIPNPRKLPPHLKFHDRKASLVDVNVRFGNRFGGVCQADSSW
jgi:cell cycle checkpoint protein